MSANTCPQLPPFPAWAMLQPGPQCEPSLCPKPLHAASRPVPWSSAPPPFASWASSALQLPCSSCLRTLASAAPLFGLLAPDGPSSKTSPAPQLRGGPLLAAMVPPSPSFLTHSAGPALSHSWPVWQHRRKVGGACFGHRCSQCQGRAWPLTCLLQDGSVVGLCRGGGHSGPPLGASAKEEGRIQGPQSLLEY